MTEISLLTDVSFAITAGVATFFSPCAYPLLPGYVGFYLNQTDAEDASLSGASARGLFAGFGVLATFGLLAGATAWIGHSAFSNITVFEYVVGALLVLFGLLVVTGYSPSLSLPLPKRRASVLGFGLFGAGYALAGAGCVAPIFLAVVARAISLPADAAVVVVATYAGIVAVLMVSVTIATGMGLLANASRLTAYSGRLKQLAGVVMVIAGLAQIYLAAVVY